MSYNKLNDIVKAVSELAGRAVEAAVTFDGLPSTEPQELPAVYSEWLQTEPNSDAYGERSGVALSLRAKHRVHTGNITVYLAATTQSVFVTEAGRISAQKLMDAFDEDSTLQDVDGVKVADSIKLTRVEPQVFQYDKTVYFGLVADWEAMEMI